MSFQSLWSINNLLGHHLEEHVCVVVVRFNVDQLEKVLHLWLTHFVVFVLVGFPQAAEDPTEKFLM